MSDVYERLREHLDRLPGGYPATESGVEIRILKSLFTPEDAELAMQMGLKLEPAKAVAERIGRPVDETEERLQDLARKGLIFSIETGDRPPAFIASQFVVGIWEYQVNKLNPDFIDAANEYFPILAKEAFTPLPQLRTIPVGKSVEAGLTVLDYERAEALIDKQKKFLVAPCICRREHQMMGGGCDKLLEACLVFGWGVDFYQRNGLGRVIDKEEALAILKKAEEDGLVLQPGNSEEINNICCCCGDCCQVLLHLKKQPKPGLAAYTPFVIQADQEACIGCEICVDRCQMDALSMEDGVVKVETDRCIGCGLCVTTCSGEALSLVRKPEDMQHRVPKNTVEAFMMRAQARAAARADLESKVLRHKDLG